MGLYASTDRLRRMEKVERFHKQRRWRLERGKDYETPSPPNANCKRFYRCGSKTNRGQQPDKDCWLRDTKKSFFGYAGIMLPNEADWISYSGSCGLRYTMQCFAVFILGRYIREPVGLFGWSVLHLHFLYFIIDLIVVLGHYIEHRGGWIGLGISKEGSHFLFFTFFPLFFSFRFWVSTLHISHRIYR